MERRYNSRASTGRARYIRDQRHYRNHGKYSFDLTLLGVGYSSDLIVEVIGNSDARMRAFVVSGTADLNPVSETAVQLVLAKLANSPTSSITDFTLNEIASIDAGIQMLVRMNNVIIGADVASTVSLITALTNSNDKLMSFLAFAAGKGQATQAPAI